MHVTYACISYITDMYMTCMHAMYNEHAFDVRNIGHRHLIGMCDMMCEVWVQDSVSYHLARTWLASMFVH